MPEIFRLILGLWIDIQFLNSGKLVVRPSKFDPTSASNLGPTSDS